MAFGLTTAIGEAILSFVQFVLPTAAPQLHDFAEKVAVAVRPDPPLSLYTADGQTVTGIVVLDHGRALLFFGTRQAAASRPAYQAPAYQAPERTYPERGYPERSYDADQSLWSPRPYTR